MHPILPLLVAWGLALCARSAPTPPEFYDPRPLGGAMLNRVGAGGGEPLNVIISSHSSPSVLINDGLLAFAGAIGFSAECFGLHLGAPHSANLGDGHGCVDQAVELRENYGSPTIGTCWESRRRKSPSGTELPVYRQDGNAANSGALFLAVSQEEDIIHEHTISPDGYNIGRDLLVQHATGTISSKGITYTTTARRLSGLLVPGASG
ncbi:hypothetical protein B0H17DRAFT_1158455 [Mycena rosella]|uniref:Uncharacterized protein n=1 Tax=Mycena rosella TaxID=1033263 RepID=A0AAD7DTD1_MYCRO|nr:hypothetical protein B0H17DRAFT_1158455 [Mycena rosella]